MKQPKTESGARPLSAKDIIITESEARRWSQMKGAQRALDQLHGEGNWGTEEEIAYFQEGKWKKWIAYLRELGAIPQYDIEDCVAAYLEVYENPTPNDIQGIKNLCSLEHQLEEVRNELAKSPKSADRKDLTKIQKDLMQEHRLQQEALGIARKTRRGKEKTTLDLIREEIEKGRQFAEDKLIRLEHCDIQLGWVLYHFQEIPHKFEFRCPRCGAVVKIEGGDLANLEIVLDKVPVEG